MTRCSVEYETRIEVAHDVDVLKARRISREMSTRLGFDLNAIAVIETAVSELATNLVSHGAESGEIVLGELNGERTGLEVRVEDKGPGILDLESAMAGGNSTAGTLGIGISGVRRLMDDFSIESTRTGTRIVARKWCEPAIQFEMEFSVYSKPKLGEQVSGDAYYIKRFPSSVLVSVIDALGHGREANLTAQKALELLDANCHEALTVIIDRCHKGLQTTRGAAIALCKIDHKGKRIEHIGIGNVETRVYGSPQSVRPFCFNGTLGMSMESSRVIEYPYADGCTVVIYSDGISGHFDLDSARLKETPQELAKYIFDHSAREYDDATVLVGR